MINSNGIKRRCILAIDDVAVVLQRIRDTLDEYYDVVTVNSGDRALRYLENEKPDLILLDIRMTPKDGFETLRDIRSKENGIDIPVIMLTGMEDKESVMEGFEMGICDYILKPFSPKNLLERIRRALDHNAQENSRL